MGQGPTPANVERRRSGGKSRPLLFWGRKILTMPLWARQLREVSSEQGKGDPCGRRKVWRWVQVDPVDPSLRAGRAAGRETDSCRNNQSEKLILPSFQIRPRAVPDAAALDAMPKRAITRFQTRARLGSHTV